MFAEIKEAVKDSNVLVCVLIDEVESLTASRKNAASSSEPSDAVRVVNALLTNIDSIRNQPNVLILTTSNITGAIDLAFVDRADIKEYVGLPSASAIYQIYRSTAQELVKIKIVQEDEYPLLSLGSLQLVGRTTRRTVSSLALWSASEESVGLSGRSLRKIPLLALSMMRMSGGAADDDDNSVSLDDYIQAVKMAVKRAHNDKMELAKDE